MGQAIHDACKPTCRSTLSKVNVLYRQSSFNFKWCSCQIKFYVMYYASIDIVLSLYHQMVSYLADSCVADHLMLHTLKEFTRLRACYGTVFQTRVVSHACMYVYYICICLAIIFNINSYGCVCVTVYILQM